MYNRSSEIRTKIQEDLFRNTLKNNIMTSQKLTGLIFLFLTIINGSLASKCAENHKGVVEHENDCAKFYSCQNEISVLQNCQNGLEFNADLMKCQTPLLKGCFMIFEVKENNKKPDCRRNQTTTIYFPHETDCTKFYSCTNGLLLELDCPKGTEFYPDKNKCDWISESGCIAGSKPIIQNDFDFSQERIPKDIFELSTLNRVKPDCPRNQTTTVYFPHETDCTKFYSCTNGLLLELDCPKGTEFYPDKNRCDWISESGCLAGSKPIIQNDLDLSQEKISKNIFDLSILNREKPDCPRNQSITILLPHETDCDKFYSCTNGILTEFPCPLGTEFNPNLGRCEHITEIGCTAGLTSSTPDTTPETTTGTTPDTTIDTTPDTTVDTTPDTTIIDTTPDTTVDTTIDTTPDTTIDTTPDTTVDTTPDTTVDTTPDTTIYTTPDTTVDTTPNTTPDTTIDSTPDTTPDTTVDTTPDTTVDSPTESNIVH